MALTAGQQDFQSLVLSSNRDGMDALRKGHMKAAFEQFKYAEAILIANQAEGDNTSLLAVTCNNLGCYYKKVGKLHGALSYLRRALKMEVDLDTDEVTLAGTHLNICAILSKLEKHDKAVQHATSALELIQQRVTSSGGADKTSQDDYSVLAIAYHNVAVERDFLQQYDQAAAAFKQGHQVAKRCLGEDHPLSVTLGKNCDAVLSKTKKMAKAPRRPFAKSTFSMTDGSTFPALADGSTALPPLPAVAGPRTEDTDAALPITTGQSVRQEAADWVAREQAEWTSFARSTLSGEPPPPPAPGPPPPPQPSLPHQASAALREAQAPELSVSKLQDSDYRPARLGTTATSMTGTFSKTPLARAVEDHPEALMDIIESDAPKNTIGNVRTAPNDFRPNRMIKGSTRANKMVRRTGMLNSTKHRDLIMSGRGPGKLAEMKKEYQEKCAAEKIQRYWRAWHKYTQENADWMTTTWICATMIQAHWRSYHVRRKKLDRAATRIQRHFRGTMVRTMLRKHQAATSIQRHAIGMLTRLQLLRLHLAAKKIQCLIRGGLGRKRARERRRFLTKTALTIQCAVRRMIAKRVVRERREAERLRRARLKAATDIQRLWRGHKGRQRYKAAWERYLRDLEEYRASTRLQAQIRRNLATKRVDIIRTDRLRAMHKASTFMRKMWLGTKQRKKYRELLDQFKRHERHVITIQRYARGFLLRLQMWREAIRAEEELWATLEIQRVWRGYKGRVRWEAKYEEVWRREMAAAMLQRNIRGWVARQKVGRMRRRIARAEFERARRRFRSAQRVQALVRGVQTRKVERIRRQRAIRAAVEMQRIWRGHLLRQRLWKQVIELRTTMIQAVARGFLVRNRRFKLIAHCISIQRLWRSWKRRPPHERAQARAERKARKDAAAVLQRKYRSHREGKEVSRIQEAEAAALGTASAGGAAGADITALPGGMASAEAADASAAPAAAAESGDVGGRAP